MRPLFHIESGVKTKVYSNIRRHAACALDDGYRFVSGLRPENAKPLRICQQSVHAANPTVAMCLIYLPKVGMETTPATFSQAGESTRR